MQCLDLFGTSSSSNGLDDNGWDVLYCNEMVMPFAQSGVSDMFVPPQQWDEHQTTVDCMAKYSLTPQFDWALDYFGGRNPKRDFAKTSNIIFSNGALDPWHVGGVNYNVSEETIAIYIYESAHHLDLRLPNDAEDPSFVKEARLIETQWI